MSGRPGARRAEHPASVCAVASLLARVILGAALVAASLLGGCATVPPPGFEARASLDPVKLVATPGVMYGSAPRSWQAPGGDVEVALEQAVVAAGLGLYLSALAYTVAPSAQGEPPLRCRASTSSTELLACDGSRHDVHLRLGPGCRYPRDLTEPACGHATLQVGSRRLQLHEGHVRRLGTPSGQLGLVDEHGTLVAAADIVAKSVIDTWLPAEPAAPVEREVALLVFVAYHQWRHRTSAD